MSTSQLKEIIVVGAGVAGTRAAETLRLDGYDGDLTIVGAERHAPYHRPPLSKKLLTGKVHRAGIDLAPQFDFEARVLRGASALRLDAPSRTLHIRDGDQDRSLKFDGLVIASGAVPRAWPGGRVPDGVLLLRTVEDCLAIRERLGSHPRIVVVGGGFIGSEVAASCRSMGLDVALIEKGAGPLVQALGKELTPHWAELHRQHGVDVRVDVGVDEFVGNGRVKAVRLTDGSQLPADLVIVGLGVAPATDWLAGSGIRVDAALSATPPGLPRAAVISSLPVMSHAGGTRCTSSTCVSSTGTMPVVKARLRLEPCWLARITRRRIARYLIFGPTNIISKFKRSE